MCCEHIDSSWKLQIFELCSITESLYFLLTNSIHSSPHFTNRKLPVDTYCAGVLYLKVVLQLWIYICRSKHSNTVTIWLFEEKKSSVTGATFFTRTLPKTILSCRTENSNGGTFPNYKVKQILRKSFSTVSLHLFHSKNQTQHREDEGSDRNLYAKFHQHYWILELLVVRNLMTMQKWKSSEKQEDDKQLGKLEDEVFCGGKENLFKWVIKCSAEQNFHMYPWKLIFLRVSQDVSDSV